MEMMPNKELTGGGRMQCELVMYMSRRHKSVRLVIAGAQLITAQSDHLLSATKP